MKLESIPLFLLLPVLMVLAACDPGPGDLLWRSKTGTFAEVQSRPAVADGVVYVKTEYDNLLAFDAFTGEELSVKKHLPGPPPTIHNKFTVVSNWASWGLNEASESSPTIVDGVVYVGSHQQYQSRGGDLMAISISHWGRESEDAVAAQSNYFHWRVETEASIVSSPAVSDGVVYAGSQDGCVYAVDASTGELLWRSAPGRGSICSLKPVSPIHSSPAVANGLVYVATDSGGVFALDITTGDPVWNFYDYEDDHVRAIHSSPHVADGVVYIGSFDSNLYALDALTGKLLWYAEADDGIWSSPIVSNGVVYFGTGDKYLGKHGGTVYALDVSSKKLLWSYTPDGAVWSSPTVSNGVVYVGSDDHYVYALDASTGERLWRYKTDGPVRSSPVVANGIVYIGSDDGHMYALLASK